MIYIQNKRFKKYKGARIKGFSFPCGDSRTFEPEGEVVGYGKRHLIVKCLNVQGWELGRMKEYNFIDPLEMDNELGFWFVSLKEVEDSLLMEEKNKVFDEMVLNGGI